LDSFAEAKADHQLKCQNYVNLIDVIKKESAYLSERAELLKQKSKTLDKVLDRVKERLVMMIDFFPDLPWRTKEGDKLRVQANPERLVTTYKLDQKTFRNVMVSIDDIEEATEFLVHHSFFTLDTERLKKALKEGRKFTFASLEQGGKHLRIH
jgi:hypothetical protein